MKSEGRHVGIASGGRGPPRSHESAGSPAGRGRRCAPFDWNPDGCRCVGGGVLEPARRAVPLRCRRAARPNRQAGAPGPSDLVDPSPRYPGRRSTLHRAGRESADRERSVSAGPPSRWQGRAADTISSRPAAHIRKGVPDEWWRRLQPPTGIPHSLSIDPSHPTLCRVAGRRPPSGPSTGIAG
jgi:hypothetical protein